MSNITISQLLSTNIAKFNSSKQKLLKSDLQMIICDTLGVDKTYLYLNSEEVVKTCKVNEVNHRVSRLLNNEPLAYIIGYKYFWNQKLFVTQDTLIPRADTETVVEAVLKDLKDKNQKLRILDLGTGTGAIALAIADEMPNSEVLAVDFSIKALEIAKKNAIANKVLNVNFIQGSWYQSLGAEKFDIIVSNPPYIDINDKYVDQEVREYEPDQALFSKDSGLEDIKIIISQASNYLNTNGRVYIEHGFLQSQLVRDIFKLYRFEDIMTVKDFGHNDRCTKGILKI